MKFLIGLARTLFEYLSFPHNLRREKLSNHQIKIINEINTMLNYKEDENSNNKLKTHILFSKTVDTLIKEKKLDNFLRQGFIQKMFFVHNRLYNVFFLRDILNSKSNLFIKLLEENSIGNPVPFFLYKKSSGNRIRHLFLLKKIFDYGQIVDVDAVIEIGGGYGCMAKIFQEINQDVDYTIFDLPEINLLQYYYLKSNYINFKIDQKDSDKILTSKIDLLNAKIDFLKNTGKKIMVIANWSISEMPLKLRDKLIFLFENCDYGIISYQSEFENISNNQYFHNLKEKLSNKFILKLNDINAMNSFFNSNTHHTLLIKRENKKTNV